MNSLHTLLTGLVDYAGLFPPAQLQMGAAVRNYADYRRGPHAWALARLIVPVGRLAEFEHAFEELAEEERGSGPWRLSVLGGRGLDADFRRILEFNRKWGGEPSARARIEALELKLHSAEETAHASDIVAESIEVYVEVPLGVDPQEWLSAASRAGVWAKARTGGVSPEMFPSTPDLARFIVACAEASVPFKATAGLHHPVRGRYPIDAHGGPTVEMHGFINVFLTAALARDGVLNPLTAASLLEERSLAAFEFLDDGVRWGNREISREHLASAREHFALSFGSCSFDEPLGSLAAVGLLTV